MKINYQELVDKAMISVVVNVLKSLQIQPSEDGLYLSFFTEHKNVKISEKLRKLHPKSMTIVLQHQFKELQIFEDGFSVELFFSGEPETLYIPFSAFKGFSDPNAGFEIQFNSRISTENKEKCNIISFDEFVKNKKNK